MRSGTYALDITDTSNTAQSYAVSSALTASTVMTVRVAVPMATLPTP